MTSGRVLLIGACIVAAAGCGSSSAAPTALHLAPQPWHTIASPRLSARAGSVVVATPTRVFVLGGFARDANPAPAVLDGASYDPESGAWQGIAAAPFAPFGAVWVRDRLFVAGSDCRSSQSEDEGAGKSEIPCPASPLRAATYDPAADKWTKLPSPDLGYEIGAYPYGDVYVIGDSAVLRLEHRTGGFNIETTYESWSAADGWKALPAPPGDDFEACQGSDAVVSLSRSPLGFRALDRTLKWSKPATLDVSYRNDPPLGCAGSAAVTWEPFGNAAHAYVYDVASGAITSLPQRHGGFPNAAVAVPAGDHAVVLWDLDGDVKPTLVYDARANKWSVLRRAPATRSGIYWLAADTGVSPDGKTFLARRLGGDNGPDTWWEMTLRNEGALRAQPAGSLLRPSVAHHEAVSASPSTLPRG